MLFAVSICGGANVQEAALPKAWARCDRPCEQERGYCSRKVMAPKSSAKECACLRRSMPRLPAAQVPFPCSVKTCAGLRMTFLAPIPRRTEGSRIEGLLVLPPSPSIDLFSGVPAFIKDGRDLANSGLRSVSIATV